MQDIANFIKKELIKYIDQEMKKGNSLDLIKSALVKAGHHHNMIEESISSLKRHKFDVIASLDEPFQGKLKKEMFFGVMNALISYVEFQLENGATIPEIEEVLTHYGHSEDTIIAAIEEVLRRREQATMPKKNKMVIAFNSLTLVILIFLVGLSTGASFIQVIAGFSPSILTVVFLVFAFDKVSNRHFMWLIPAVLVMLFFIIATSKTMDIFVTMEVKTLGIVNLVISFFYVAASLAFEPKIEE